MTTVRRRRRKNSRGRRGRYLDHLNACSGAPFPPRRPPARRSLGATRDLVPAVRGLPPPPLPRTAVHRQRYRGLPPSVRRGPSSSWTRRRCDAGRSPGHDGADRRDPQPVARRRSRVRRRPSRVAGVLPRARSRRHREPHPGRRGYGLPDRPDHQDLHRRRGDAARGGGAASTSTRPRTTTRAPTGWSPPIRAGGRRPSGTC